MSYRSRSRHLQKPRGWADRLSWAVVLVTAVVGITVLVSMGVERVRAARGLESYRTVWLVEFNWVALVVLVACIFVALAVGAAIAWRQRRREAARWRELEHKYGAPTSDA